MDDVQVYMHPSKSELDNCFQRIRQHIEFLEGSNEDLRKKIEEFRKDDEIKKLEEQLESVYKRSLMVMSDLECKRDKEFTHRHYETCKNPGRFIYDLAGTGIGTVIKIKCPICGEEENITDIGSW